MLILGLDVSTSTVGWSLYDNDWERPILGFISLKSEDTLIQKATMFQKEIDLIVKKFNVDAVYIEEDLQKFTRGMSSAATLQKLSRFNGMACLVMYNVMGYEPTHLNVNLARKSIGCKVDRTDKSKTTKEKVFAWVDDHLCYPWPTKVVLRGERKGEIENLKECFDMADAFVISKAGYLDYKKKIKQ
jgi:hypothetical protein